MSESNVQLIVEVAVMFVQPVETVLDAGAGSSATKYWREFVSVGSPTVTEALFISPATPASNISPPPVGALASNAIVLEVEEAILAPASLSLTVTRVRTLPELSKPLASQ